MTDPTPVTWLPDLTSTCSRRRGERPTRVEFPTPSTYRHTYACGCVLRGEHRTSETGQMQAVAHAPERQCPEMTQPASPRR